MTHRPLPSPGDLLVLDYPGLMPVWLYRPSRSSPEAGADSLIRTALMRTEVALVTGRRRFDGNACVEVLWCGRVLYLVWKDAKGVRSVDADA